MTQAALTEQDFVTAAQQLGCDVAAVKAVCTVEAPRGGFNPDGTPVTLFEGHKFHAKTAGQYDAQAPDISYPKWTKQFYGHSWEAEQDRLARAIALDRNAALESASWGRFQIMGENWKSLGYDSVQAFVDDMYAGEGGQLKAFVAFCEVNGLAQALANHNWAAFARGYNGAAYAENQYDIKLAKAYANNK